MGGAKANPDSSINKRSLLRTVQLTIDRCEPVIEWIIRLCGWSAILFVFAIFFFVFREGSGMLFENLDLKEFFSSPNWRPNSVVRAQYGVLALLIGTVAVTGLAMLIWQIGAGHILVGTARHLALVIRSRGWVPLETAEREPLKRSLFLAPSALAGVLMTLTGAAESLRDYI